MKVDPVGSYKVKDASAAPRKVMTTSNCRASSGTGVGAANLEVESKATRAERLVSFIFEMYDVPN